MTDAVAEGACEGRLDVVERGDVSGKKAAWWFGRSKQPKGHRFYLIRKTKL
jgi:hypothetical protein